MCIKSILLYCVLSASNIYEQSKDAQSVEKSQPHPTPPQKNNIK